MDENINALIENCLKELWTACRELYSVGLVGNADVINEKYMKLHTKFIELKTLNEQKKHNNNKPNISTKCYGTNIKGIIFDDLKGENKNGF